MFYILNQLGWLAFTALLIVVVVFYVRINRQIGQLRRDVGKLQIQLRNQRNSNARRSSVQPTDNFISSNNHVIADSAVDTAKLNTTDETNTTVHAWPPSRPTTPQSSLQDNAVSSTSTTGMNETLSVIKSKTPITSIQPDERSLPIVTSLFHSVKNWFFGGNLVVRVGVLVLLVGVVLLLRLLSDYIEIPIAFKLMAIGVAGLGLAGLGLKLTAKRFSYGITLQGAGLAIAYLSTFFAYSVYEIIPSLPSFIGLGLLSAITIALAVRQNAFPLALLSLSGGFFAPILTSDDTGSLVALFSYYLLLNVTIAVIAHYRPWKILNLFGVTVTFGLAYYWGISENLTAIIETQRWSLVLLVALHLMLYLFMVIRYAQQIIAYNTLNEEDLSHTDSADNIEHLNEVHVGNSTYLFPIDTGLLFSVPLLAFGLFSALLEDIPHALTMTSAVLGTVYLGLGWLFIQRSQRYALITEGMLALGFGFLALVIPLALDAEWIAFGWSVQGLALAWFGRRSLRAWSVLFGVLLQLISVVMLMATIVFSSNDYPILALSISAIAYLAIVFILRASNSPAILNDLLDVKLSANSDSHLVHAKEKNTTSDSITTYASALGISDHAAQQWLTSVNSQSKVFGLVWRSPRLIWCLTLTAVVWMLQVLVLDVSHWFEVWQLDTMTIALAALVSLAIYWSINRYQPWAETKQLSHGLLLLFYLMLVLQLPQKFELNLLWSTAEWLVFASLFIGWLTIGQLWLKFWHDDASLSRYDGASWLGAGILVIAAAAHYGLPASAGVMAILIPTILILAGLWCSYRYGNPRQIDTSISENSTHGLLYWFDWQQALLSCAAIFAPIALSWVIITNWSYDGVIWDMSYFPLLNLYDMTSGLALLVGFSVYYLNRQHNHLLEHSNPDISTHTQKTSAAHNLLIILGLISFWLISSMLVRTLHAFIDTPLWNSAQGGAWQSEQVQTGLTMLWTLLALVATIIASRYWQRALWFMGIGLLGVVVLKLVLVDLSQTEAIWRVISFLGAGSLILLIGYLAPLPPADDEVDEVKDKT
ncbi:DUF2339 domain-containing protein [Psychrobacter sp. APC 3350]|uniref:DUF2339 domain-containing protein n=1 Tax=Psychrobacter sp. APC 3350 TaxID=3035195 RepID=UPI0025B3760B|nr:DUF2339 domain-containing protein [Psychrobacter sp. APC 3350]MDN3452947.1 DUF2339 domain-containing protein [Psychrobacter sp. APC 3350]